MEIFMVNNLMFGNLVKIIFNNLDINIFIVKNKKL